MRKLLLTLAFLYLFCYTHAQDASPVGMRDEFREISRFGSRGSGFEGFQTYTSGIVNGSQFFHPTWAPGSVTTATNETFSKNYLFLFDKVRQELFIKWKDSATVLQADKNQVTSFTLNTDRLHNFVASSTYDPSKKGMFYEVLEKSDKGYTLLKFIKTKFVKGDPRDIEKQKLGEIYDAFEDEITYYMSYNHGIPEPITLKEKGIKKSLASVKPKVDDYFQQHRGNTTDEAFLEDLLRTLNNSQ